MATFYYNHESELYHSGRKGMKWGKHLPDILDPTRELVGKIANPVKYAYKKTKKAWNYADYPTAERGLTNKYYKKSSDKISYTLDNYEKNFGSRVHNAVYDTDFSDAKKALNFKEYSSSMQEAMEEFNDAKESYNGLYDILERSIVAVKWPNSDWDNNLEATKAKAKELNNALRTIRLMIKHYNTMKNAEKRIKEEKEKARQSYNKQLESKSSKDYYLSNRAFK